MLARVLLAALSAGAAGAPSPAPGRFLSPRRDPGNESASGDDETAPLARALESGPTCGGLGDLLGDSDCGGAAVDAFSDILETAGELLSGRELDQDAWKDLALGSVKALGGVLGAFMPFPVSMLSQLVIPLFSGMHGQLTAAAAEDSSASYVALQQLFRQSMKSNGARYQALVDEWKWFQTLRNQTLNNNGALYEAAALSWLLNVQHDLAIEQESFFNVECLQMLEKKRFANISEGRCEDIGLAPISDVAICDVAGHHLKGRPLDVNDNVESLYDQSKPQGCYWYDGHEKPYVNFHPDSATTKATEVRQSLCTSVSRESQTECAAWHEADTWQVSQWYAVLHLVILTDIYNLYPELQETTLKRVNETGAEYILLLTHSFKSSLEKRKAHLKEPQSEECGWLGCSVTCKVAPISGPIVRLTEGRDYYHQKLAPQEGAVVDDDNDDGKCRGACDVLSSARCPYRKEKGGTGEFYSKYCVSKSIVSAAEDCWGLYRDEVVSNLTALFDNKYMKNLRSLHATALRQLQNA